MQITPRGFYPQQAVRVITRVITGCFGVITPRSPKGRPARDQVQAKKLALPLHLPMFSLLTTSMVLLAFRTGMAREMDIVTFPTFYTYLRDLTLPTLPTLEP